jgi:hypothetical protein
MSSTVTNLDAKTIDCSAPANSTACAGITSFPTVVCNDGSKIVGYCP